MEEGELPGTSDEILQSLFSDFSGPVHDIAELIADDTKKKDKKKEKGKKKSKSEPDKDGDINGVEKKKQKKDKKDKDKEKVRKEGKEKQVKGEFKDSKGEHKEKKRKKEKKKDSEHPEKERSKEGKIKKDKHKDDNHEKAGKSERKRKRRDTFSPLEREANFSLRIRKSISPIRNRNVKSPIRRRSRSPLRSRNDRDSRFTWNSPTRARRKPWDTRERWSHSPERFKERRRSRSPNRIRIKEKEVTREELMAIAQKNAVRLALEGKLPKNFDIATTMKNKTIKEMIKLCEEISSKQFEFSFPEKAFEEKDEEFDFSTCPIKPSANIKLNVGNSMAPKSALERLIEGNALRKTFPISSGDSRRSDRIPDPAWEPVTMEGGVVSVLSSKKVKIAPAFLFSDKADPPPPPKEKKKKEPTPEPVPPPVLDAPVIDWMTVLEPPPPPTFTAGFDAPVSHEMPPAPQIISDFNELLTEEERKKIMEGGTLEKISGSSSSSSTSSSESEEGELSDDEEARRTRWEPVDEKNEEVQEVAVVSMVVIDELEYNCAPSTSMEEIVEEFVKEIKETKDDVEIVMEKLINDVILEVDGIAEINIDNLKDNDTNVTKPKSYTVLIPDYKEMEGHVILQENNNDTVPPKKDNEETTQKKKKLEPRKVEPITIQSFIGPIKVTHSASTNHDEAMDIEDARPKASHEPGNERITAIGDSVFGSFMNVPSFTQNSLEVPLVAPVACGHLVQQRAIMVARLEENPNDFSARMEIADIDIKLSRWAESKGNSSAKFGAASLIDAGMEARVPNNSIWATKDTLKNAPELIGGIGAHLLHKMGWRPGYGLGRRMDGPTEPLMLDVKADRKGLFSAVEKKPVKRERTVDFNGKNPVSVVMEYCSKHSLPPPLFVPTEDGTPHQKRFGCTAVLNGTEYNAATASSNKKAAKAQVCLIMCRALGLV